MAVRPSSRPRVAPLCVLLLSAAVATATLFRPTPAAAEIRRCERADGTSVYTDRACADLGAVERPPALPSAGAAPARPAGCARSVQDLAWEVSAAIEAHDANRLAGVYHWVGMSAGDARAVMARLEEISARPLVDVVPVSTPDAAPAAGTAAAPYQATAPIGLRVEQTLANGTTPATARFGLQRHFGCIWISG